MELKNLILGFDFGEKESQICCYDRADRDAVSVPIRKGSIEEAFPTVLFKKPGEDKWYAAVRGSQEDGEEAEFLEVEHLYEVCMNERPYMIEDTAYAPGELLAVFLRQRSRRQA